MIWSVFVFNMELANGRSVFAGLKNQRFWFNSKRLHKIYLRVVRMARHQSAKLIYAGSNPVSESIYSFSIMEMQRSSKAYHMGSNPIRSTLHGDNTLVD